MRAIVKGLVVWTNVATAMTKLLLRRCPMRYSMTLLMLSTIALLFGLVVTAPLSVALAAPKGPGGQACKSSGTTTVNGTEEGTGKKLKCTADYCKYDECETSGPNIGKCFEKTHYSNVRDCKPAALTKRPQTLTPGTRPAVKQVEPPTPVSPSGPRAPVGGTVKEPATTR